MVLTVLLCSAAWAEKQPDYGFENVHRNGIPADWRNNTSVPVAEVESVSGPDVVRSGESAVRLVGSAPSPTDDGAGHYYTNFSVPIDPTQDYELSVWRKGSGRVAGSVYLYTVVEGGDKHHSSATLPAKGELQDDDDDWVRDEFVLKADRIPDEVKRARVVLRVGGEVVVDDVSFRSTSEAAAAETDTSGSRPNLITVGSAPQAPVAEGRIGDDEYPVVFTGLLDQQTSRIYPYENRVGLAWQDGRLHVAVELELPPGYEVQERPSRPDDAGLISQRDTVYLVVRPEAETDRESYQGLYVGVNGGGVFDAWQTIDWAKGSLERDAGFDAQVRSATSVEGRRWTTEFSVSGQQWAGPGAGSTHALSLGVLMDGYRPSWQLHANWFDHPQAFGLLRLVDHDAALASVPALGMLSQGDVAPQIEVRNGGSEELTIEAASVVALPRMMAGQIGSYIFDVAMNTRIAEAVADEAVDRWSERAVVEPSRTVSLSHAAELKTPRFHVMEVDVRAGGEAVFYQKVPFEFQEGVAVELSTYPAAGELKAIVSLRGTPAASRGALAMKMLDAEGNEIWSESARTDSDTVEMILPLGTLEPGAYQIKSELRDPQGGLAATNETIFTKPETPDWLANPKGMAALDPDWLPQPWTAVEATDEAAKVWGRAFEFAEGSLLAQAFSQDKALLAKPVTLSYQTPSGTQDFHIEPPALVEKHDGQAVYEQTGEASHFTLQARHQIEFDGMNRIDLTITPRGEVGVDEMWIDVPYAPTQYAVSWSQDNYWQHGLVSNQTFLTPRAYTLVWLGDDKAGLGFFIENYKGWRVDSTKPRITIQIDEESQTLRLHLINTPVKVGEPMQITFGLHATPTKPLFEGWRGVRPQGLAVTPPPTTLVMAHSDYWGASDYNPYPRTWELYREIVDYLHERDQKMYPYLTGFSISPYYKIAKEYGFDRSFGRIPEKYRLNEKTENNRNETYFYYRNDWHLDPPIVNTTPVPTREEARTSATSSWSDYFLGGVHDMLEKSGMDGVYVDIHKPSTNYDASKGYLHITEDGVREGSAELFATRDFYKRMYYIFGQFRSPDDRPWIMGHGYGILLPYSSFWDINFNGEEIKPKTEYEFTALNMQHIMEGQPLAVINDGPSDYEAHGYRSVFSIASGSVNMILPQYGYLPELKTRETARETLSLTFMHNDLLWPAYLASGVIYDFWSDVEVPYDMADTTFHPYWDNGTQTSAPHIKASYWTKPGTTDLLLAVANWSASPTTATVKLPDDFAGFAEAELMELDSTAPVNDGQIQLEIPAHDLVILRFQR
jgi:hypothetical protein